MLGELPLVSIKLLLEERHFTLCLSFFQLTELSLVLLFLLRVLVQEVLLLGFNNYRQLRLFTLYLLNEFLKVCDLFKVLDFLSSNFLVERQLILLTSDLVFNTSAKGVRATAEFVVVVGLVLEEWRKVIKPF